jgi:hypothetical protein
MMTDVAEAEQKACELCHAFGSTVCSRRERSWNVLPLSCRNLLSFTSV